MGTRTCSTFLREPQALHVGTNVVLGKWDDATLSTGDVVKIGKIPDRAVIMAGTMSRPEPGGDITMRLKIPMEGASATASSTYTTMMTSTATGIVNLLENFVGYQISISDHCIIKEVDVELLNASASTTGTINFALEYRMDMQK